MRQGRGRVAGSSTVAVFGPWVSNPTWLMRTAPASGSACAAPKAAARANAATPAVNLFLTPTSLKAIVLSRETPVHASVPMQKL